jgi:hypothetical protein
MLGLGDGTSIAAPIFALPEPYGKQKEIARLPLLSRAEPACHEDARADSEEVRIARVCEVMSAMMPQ